ncbi:MAG: formylglycine-generating enzyme family protein [Rhodocyclaceae bacterium]|nr:formylglycine-generating enzyme family protein [Rhodocyclaceae bacterium]
MSTAIRQSAAAEPWPPQAQRWPPAFPPPWASAFGDDPRGLWADATIFDVVQRFRWIEPGEFWMGSPADEAERTEDEGPRHRVRLTQGFWLADTACSQALWQAVMGENPSHFTDDPQNPVEQVRWDEVQGFLERVGGSLPGGRAELPTEAEWEYACRAGSETAFHWGETIDPSQANYNGNLAYAGGATGEYRARTVPVKSFAPNAWGLYQMHGNVWEWCADDRREYRDEACTDPRGPEGGGAERAVRGGGWLSGPGGLRSAYRSRGHRGGRYVPLGFRFALRSTGPAAGAERPKQAPLTRDA